MPLFGPNIKKMEKNADIEGLSQALRHDNDKSREEAVLALDRLAWKPQNDDDKAWYLVAKRNWQELTELGAPALPALFLAMSHSMKSVRMNAGDTLEKIALSNPDSTLPLLCEALCNQLIASAITSKFTEARNRTVKILGKMGDARAILPLMQSENKFRDLDYRSHRNEFKPSKTVTLKSDAYSKLVKQTINEMGETAISHLVKLMDSEKRSDRIEVINAMGQIKDDRIFNQLVITLQDKNPEIRRAAIKALGEFDDKRITEYLVESLRDSYYWVRIEAYAQLSKNPWRPSNDEEKAYFILAKLLHSIRVNGMIKNANWKELRSMGRKAVNPLIRSLNLEGDIAYTTFTYKSKKLVQQPARGLVIEMLSQIGKAAKPGLEEAIMDPDPIIQQGAAETLKRIR